MVQPDVSAMREETHDIGPFAFEGGGRLESLRIGYAMHGELNATRDNLLLVLPGTANTRHSADGYIGPGKAFDTHRYCVVAVDAIGAGTSSKPSDGLRGAFPHYNIRDMVRAQAAFVTGAFGPTTRIACVAGASMGAFQALEWAIHYSDMVHGSILMVPAVRASNVFRAAVRAATDVVQMDPAWNAGDYTTQPLKGLRAAGRLYYPWTVTDAYIESLSASALQDAIHQTVTRATQWDAWDFIRRYQASASHDIAAPFGGDVARALTRVASRMLILPVSTDRLLPVSSARQIAEHVAHARYVEVPSEHGHLGWRPIDGAPEAELISAEIQRFLNEGKAS
ncbi:alpha/beta fold hydrolase [Ottowia thiooxydans]|uniref:Homoserine O-acetyltransferase n=1 Tax=Ottowia thiooxydans TaxID=219182 RepID=A0ABV2Q482_9BURK